MTNAHPNKTLSKIFCDSSADLEFESSDEVVFKIHSKHLPSTSFGFVMGEGDRASESQPAQLSESAEILELLFQFVEPPSESRHFQYPSLTELDPAHFFTLAEAAEKYIVFACMGMCATRMRFDTAMMEAHALDVLNHSFKHGYNDLVLTSIWRTLQNCNFELVAEKLTTPGLLAKWVRSQL
ncbi:hypothetical protein D9619_012802 [Psilocybe cf. subviscida]|uniref:BTB domain-containing protein n=1 Tax=Psilocybe cf. subviscida TaxID=2480587 RepID=A0A8H5AQC7_9AGAR|nr:hypothetical protein D9619_012802 [Psilocybe cf. subviscida]